MPLRPLALALPLVLAACSGGESLEPQTFALALENTSEPGALETTDGETHDIMLAPAIVIVHDAEFALFTVGEPLALAGVEALAEDGDPAELEATLAGIAEVHQIDTLTRLLEVTYDAAPLLPGDRVEDTVSVAPGQLLTVAFMFGESNDVLVGALGVALLDDEPYEGAIPLALYDVGTEVNQEPGLGADQPARQEAANTGEDEGGVVTAIVDVDGAGFAYPSAASFAELTASWSPEE